MARPRRKFIQQNPAGKWGFDLRFTDPETGRKTIRIRRFEFDSWEEAERVALRLLRDDQSARHGIAPPAPAPSLRRILEHRRDALPEGPERTRAARVIRTWLALLPGGLRATDLTTPHLRLFVERRQADGQSAASINRELNILAAALNAAPAEFPELGSWRPPKIPRPRVSKSRRERIITDDEYRRLLDHLRRPPDAADAGRRQNQRNAYAARQRVAAVFEFAINTGMQPSEIYRLEWAAIDWDGRRIKVVTTKTDTVRYVPLSAAVAALLEAQRGAERGPYVFTRGGGPTPKIYRVLREACEAVGIPYGRKTRDGFELYCSRHTFTTRMLQSGVDMRVVGDVTGHSDRQMVLHYSHTSPESTARARGAMEAIQRQRQGGAAEDEVAALIAWLAARIDEGRPIVIEPARFGELRGLLERAR